MSSCLPNTVIYDSLVGFKEQQPYYHQTRLAYGFNRLPSSELERSKDPEGMNVPRLAKRGIEVVLLFTPVDDTRSTIVLR
jgi:hypothetical protein